MMAQNSFRWNGVVFVMCGFPAICGCNNSTMDNADTTATQPSPSGSDLQTLLSEMSSTDRDIQTAALRRGLTYRVEPADRVLVPQMIEMLQDDDSEVKLVMLSLLGQLGKDAVPALPAIRDCLESHDKDVRGWAQETIEEIEGGDGDNNESEKLEIGPAVEKRTTE